MGQFDALKLSKDPIYTQAPPAVAAAYSQAMMTKLLGNPGLRKELESRGLLAEAYGIIDGPTETDAIEADRAWKREHGAGVLEPVERALTVMFKPTQGIYGKPDVGRRVSKGAADFVAQYGLDQVLGGEGTDPGIPEDYVDVPLLGRVDPIAMGTQIVSNLAPILAGQGLAQSALTKLGAPAGIIHTGSYALGGGGNEALQQASRVVLNGDKFDPGRIVQQTAVFGAAGLPVSRPIAALLAGGATMTPAIWGGDVDPREVGTNVLFGLLFGNPQMTAQNALANLDNVSLTSKDATKRQAGLLKEVAEASEGQAQKEMATRANLAKDVSTPEAAFMREVLKRSTKADQKVVARDIAVAGEGKVVPPDAPIKNSLTDIPKADIEAQAAEVHAKASAAYARGNKAKGDALWRQYNEMRAAAATTDLSADLRSSLTKELGHQPPTPDASGRTITDLMEGAKRKDVPIMEPVMPRDKISDAMREWLQPEFELGLADLRKEIRIELDAPSPNLARVQELQGQLADLKGKAQAFMDRDTRLPQVTDEAMALRLVDGLAEDLGVSGLRQLKKDGLPQLAPYTDAVNAHIDTKIANVRKTDPLMDKLTGILDELDKQGELVLPRPEPSGPLSLAKVRRSAAKYGAKIERRTDLGGAKRGPGMYRLVHQGKEYNFKGLKGAQKFINDIADGNIPKGSQAAVEIAGADKGIRVRHVGDGEYMATNAATGEQVVYPSLDKAREAIASEPTPAPVPELETLVPDMGVTVPGEGGVGPSGSGTALIHADTEIDLDFMPTNWTRWNTQRNVMLDYEAALKQPIYSEGWRPVMDGMSDKNVFMRPYVKGLNKAFRWTRSGRHAAVMDVFLAGDARRKVAEAVGLTKGELRAVRGMEKHFKDLLNIDDTGLKGVIDFMGDVRKANGDPNRAMKNWEAPAGLTELYDDVLNGYVRLDADNALALSQDLLMAVGNRRYMQAPVKQARKLIGQLDSEVLRSRGKGYEGPIENSAHRDAYRQASAQVAFYVDAVQHGSASGSKKLAGSINGWLDKMKDIGLIRKDMKVTSSQISDLSDNIIGYYSGLAMSARPALAMRNLFQMLMAGPKVGYTNVFKALMKSVTKEGRAMMADSGISGMPSMFILDDLTRFAAGQQSVGGKIRGAQSAGLVPYRGADMMNRAVNYIAGHDTVVRYAPLLKKGKIEEFLLQTGLATDSPVIQKKVLGDLQKDMLPQDWDAAIEKAAKFYGKHLQEEAQYVYSRANAPQRFQSVVGKAFGQFGLWPVSFMEYMGRNLGGRHRTRNAMAKVGAVPMNSNVVTKGSAAFMARYLGMRAAMMGTGLYLGAEVYNYNLANPYGFEGGPAYQMARDAVTITMGAGTEFEQRAAWSNTQRWVSELPNPFGAAAHDWRQAMDEPDPLIALALGLGFNVKTTQQRQNERRRR